MSDGETENVCSSSIDGKSKMSNLKMTIGKAKKGGSLTVTMQSTESK